MRHGVVLGLLFALSTQAGCGSSSSSGGGGGTGGGGGGAARGGTGGGAGGSGGGGSVTTVTGSKSLRTLTSAETASICSDSEAYFNAHISVADQCKLLAVGLTTLATGGTDASIQSTCTTFYTACTTGGPSQTCDTGQFATCAPTATVTEFSTCFADNTAATKVVIDGLPACSALTAASLSTLNLTIPPPASCTTLLAECPDINTGS